MQSHDLDLHRLELRFAASRLVEPRAVERIARSIERCGQIVACIVVAGGGEDGAMVVVDGYRRIAAVRQLGRDTVRVEVWPCSVTEALVAVLARSQDRPFAAIEEALALRELVQGQGLSQHELARRCGRDVSWVSRRLQLLSGLPDEALAAVRAGRLSSWAANRVVAPLARANSDHANRLLERLVTEPLSTRELRDWFQHYERALVGVREEMVRRPRLFIQAQDEIRQERATQRLRQGPEGQCATDVRILESVLGRLVQRTADLRPVPKGVIRAAPRLQAALNKLTSIINREDGHDPDRYPRRGADPDGAGPWRARDQPSSEVVAEHGAADSAGAGAGQG